MMKRLQSWGEATKPEKIGLVFIALGFLIPIVVWTYFGTRKWIPLDEPIELAAGKTSTFQFKVRTSGLYRISIRTNRTIPFDELDCLLGLRQQDPYAASCGNTVQVLDLTWQLYRSGKQVEHGLYADRIGGGYSEENIDAEFAQLHLKRGDYTLSISPTKDGRLLARANPRAHVEILSDYYVGSILMQLSSVFLGVFLIVSGSAMIAIQQWRLRRRKHALQQKI